MERVEKSSSVCLEESGQTFNKLNLNVSHASSLLYSLYMYYLNINIYSNETY